MGVYDFEILRCLKEVNTDPEICSSIQVLLDVNASFFVTQFGEGVGGVL